VTDSVASISVEEHRPGQAAATGGMGGQVVPRSDRTQATIAPDDGMDPDFVAFFTTTLPQVVTAARRVTGDLAAAEDAASEAMAKAYLRWPELRHLAHRRAWVLRVAINEAIATVRAQARRERILRRQPPERAVLDEPQETPQGLVGHIRRLPRRQREVISLRYYAELTTEEVASTLGISAGAVKSHVHRALGTLRERLGTDIPGGTLE
jgi:RNA polymerase sigma-70 factor (sigma-E family)